jgi:hypothetical protein
LKSKKYLFKYLWSVLRHKWYTFVACREFGVTWLGIIHDLSKFTPAEFFPYAEHFYGGSEDDTAINEAFKTHIGRNKHHYQYWTKEVYNLKQPHGSITIPVPMPEKYVREMVADWIGAGKAYGNDSALEWYNENSRDILVLSETREIIEKLLEAT